MKKIIALILIALVAVSSAFAFKFKSLGIETGFGEAGGLFFTGDMEINKNFDVYARIGFSGWFNISGGAQYTVGTFKMSGTDVAVSPGAQMNFNFDEDAFFFYMLGTCQFSFEAGHLTGFVRPGLGLAAAKNYSDFIWDIETGVAYLF